MTTESRIYAVKDEKSTRLVDAMNPAQARRHCTTHLRVSVPSAKEVAAMVAAGVKVETAGAIDDTTEARR